MNSTLINSLRIDKTSKYSPAPDIAGFKIIFVNIYMIGYDNHWVLVDAGLAGFSRKIIHHAEELFGSGTKPRAIVLTHGHFDHTGSLEALLKEWKVPVYAHSLELPYLTGKSNYPPPDPSIGGGAMAYMSWTFPVKPLHLKDRIIPVQEGSVIPELSDWKVVHTPGHAPGHISLFRERDRVLIAGDAFVTVDQNSAIAVMTQKEEVNGPPAYFTCDWQAAKMSVQKLNALRPLVAACGHGIPMKGLKLQNRLHQLALNFDKLAIPSNGRYVKRPALTDEEGIVDMPSPISYHIPRVITTVTITALAGFIIYAAFKRKRPKIL
jgi:glyoxylase-like metal-dependent hydrolase (beta-lactamase superfamily II)